MEQRITPEDLQELTDEQRERLREWWVVREGDRFFAKGKWEDIAGESAPGCVESYDFDGESWDKKDCLPLLSVGQCIELLEEKYPNGISFHSDWGDCSEVWIVLVQDTQGDDPPDSFIDRITITRDHELIDALWQAVKEVL
jgi:hypothetical protein